MFSHINGELSPRPCELNGYLQKNRSLLRKNDQVQGHVSKTDQVKGYVSKIDQLKRIRIAVDRFFKLTSSFDRFFKLAFLLDRLLIGRTEICKKYVILRHFSRQTWVQSYNLKGLVESFPLVWLNIILTCKLTKIRTNPVLGSTQNRWELSTTDYVSFLMRYKLCLLYTSPSPRD